jgi:STE24 endopeptidase
MNLNAFSVLFLLFLAGALCVQGLLVLRHVGHVRRHRDQVPEAFRERIPAAAHRKAADYTSARVRAGFVEFVISLAILLVWTLGGALSAVDGFWRTQIDGQIGVGTAFIVSVLLIGAVLDLPFSVYRTFVLEQRFGFNRTTPRLFLADLFKQTLLFAIIGVPMIVLVLWIMEGTGGAWWLFVWLTWLAFSLAMMWAYPAFIAPLFNRFRPLEDQALRRRIEDLLARNGFTSNGIFVMDGSARSTHGNAYFTGLGGNKRIVFFDTLMNELSHEEIEAVLAHELGHFKCRHISKRIVTLAAVFLFGLALLGWLIDQPWFYTGLGVTQPSTYMGLALFVMVSPVFTYFLQPLFSWMSRRHEFEADDFAAAQAQTANLIQALVKLYRENANTLTPDPLYSAFHDSHPPAPIRIAHLNAKLA